MRFISSASLTSPGNKSFLVERGPELGKTMALLFTKKKCTFLGDMMVNAG